MYYFFVVVVVFFFTHFSIQAISTPHTKLPSDSSGQHLMFTFGYAYQIERQKKESGGGRGATTVKRDSLL